MKKILLIIILTLWVFCLYGQDTEKYVYVINAKAKMLWDKTTNDWGDEPPCEAIDKPYAVILDIPNDRFTIELNDRLRIRYKLTRLRLNPNYKQDRGFYYFADGTDYIGRPFKFGYLQQMDGDYYFYFVYLNQHMEILRADDQY